MNFLLARGAERVAVGFPPHSAESWEENILEVNHSTRGTG